MINRQMQKCKLYKNQKIPDKYNKLVDNYVYTKDVDVAINFISVNRRGEDLRYKDCEYSGLTLDKELLPNANYKIVDEQGNEYEIKSINLTPRLTQLLLKVVV